MLYINKRKKCINVKKEISKKITELIEPNLDDNGKFIIDMMILDDESFISPFCGRAPIISSDVATYLDNSIKTVPPKAKVTLHISSEVIAKDKEEVHVQSIRNYYQNERKQLIRELLSNKLASLTMFIIGLIVIAIMIAFSFLDFGEIWITILEIIGWVFVWEAVDKFVFERNKLKKDLLRANQLINAEVIFKRNSK